MDPAKLPHFRLVVALDATDEADAVLEFALDQASRHEQPDIHVVRVIDGATEDEQQSARQRLAAICSAKLETFAPAKPEPAWRVRLHVRPGRIAEEIINLAYEVEADLLVIGGPTVGRIRPHLSHITEHVLASAPCPVLVVRVTELEEHELAARQCPDCVAVRAESDGERWFCEAHAGTYFGTSTLLMGHSEPLTRGGPMW
jgi:nucleotide-binding universal stress UspA family protein